MGQHHPAQFKAHVVRAALREEKTLAQFAGEYGGHPTQISTWKTTALAELPRIFERRDQTASSVATYEARIEQLYAEIGRLTTHGAWLGEKWAAYPRAERLAMVEFGHPEVALGVPAALLGLSRSGLYYRPVAPAPQGIALKQRIDEVYPAHPYYGSRRIAAVLRHAGQVITRKAGQRHMQEMGIAGLAPGPHTSRRRPQHPVYPYLPRHVVATYPNHVWGIDITYVRLRAGWLYLVAILDWYARYVVAWELDQSLELGFVLACLDAALALGRPTIWNSDQGSHFTSPQDLGRLQERGIRISMDGKGRALDNIFTERPWRSVTYEEVYLHSYDSPRAARQGLARYFQFYNHRRPHQALGYQTPAALYCGTRSAATVGDDSLQGGESAFCVSPIPSVS